ncbi:hypothetical protein LUZ60_003576 [Juncus effusus]|nr:hypothetical protein LUZ60_003576 [Juncus effusus]
MALRSIDNNLPEALERPKKAAKITGSPSPVPKSKAVVLQDSCKNEKSTMEPQINVAEQSVEYVLSADLKALSDPEIKIQNLLAELDSKDWIKACGALNDVRRFALFHSSLLIPILENVMNLIVKILKSPRSALLKTSLMACTDIFSSFGHCLISSDEKSAFDTLLLQLLLKASQDKRFVCEEAEKALDSLNASISPLPLLKKLRSSVTHSNLRVRAKAAVAVSKCVSRLETETMKEFGMPTILQIASVLLNDKLPEAREAARSMVNSVYAIFSMDAVNNKEKDNGEPVSLAELWESFCCSNLPAVSAQVVVKIVSMEK